MSDAVASWNELEARLRPFVARRVLPSDVDDVLQDVFVRMQRGLPQLRDDDRLGPWVYQVARSAVADHGRMRARHPLPRSADDVEQVAPLYKDGDDDENLAASLLATSLSTFVARLPSPYREAVTLVELEGLTAKEAAEMVGISVSGMKSRVQRGRARLREMLEECCEIAVDVRGRVTGFTPREPRCDAPACCPPRR